MVPYSIMTSVLHNLPQNEVGKGAFQELDQLAAVQPYVKYAGQAASTADIPRVVAEAFQVGDLGRSNFLFHE